jgi:hypothetical protein
MRVTGRAAMSVPTVALYVHGMVEAHGEPANMRVRPHA